MKNRFQYLAFFNLFFAMSVFSQNCKSFTSGEDEFTMEKITYYGNFFQSNYYSSLIDKTGVSTYLLARKATDGTFYLAIQSMFPTALKIDHPDWFKPGVKFLLKLDKEVLTFTVDKPQSMLQKITFSSKTRNTILYLESPITKEQLLKISEQSIEKIRYFVHADSEDIFEDIRPDKVYLGKIRSQFKCLAQ